MRIDGTNWTARIITQPLIRIAICMIAGLTVLSGALASAVYADPQQDALAKLTELSREAEQTTEAMHSAQLDLNEKLEVQAAAEAKLAADHAAAEAAQAQLAVFQAGVNKFAAAQYMGGRTSGFNAILTAGSPQGLIDTLAVQRVMATEMSAQMSNFRAVSEQAKTAEANSVRSAAEAKTAAEQAAAVRADLQSSRAICSARSPWSARSTTR